MTLRMIRIRSQSQARTKKINLNSPGSRARAKIRNNRGLSNGKEIIDSQAEEDAEV